MKNIGFRIYNSIKRPGVSLVDSFRDIPVANISDNMGRIGCMDSTIKPFNKVKLVGVAFTVRVPANDNLILHKAIDMAEPGDVIIVNGEGSMDHALMGEIMFRYAISRKIVGFVLDGCIRDVESLENLNISVYAKGVNPKGPYKNGPGEINVPISCGGLVVHPGDIIVGDADGLVVIKPDDAAFLLTLSAKQHENEIKTFKDIEEGTLNREWVDKFLTEKGCEYIN